MSKKTYGSFIWLLGFQRYLCAFPGVSVSGAELRLDILLCSTNSLKSLEEFSGIIEYYKTWILKDQSP